MQTQNGILFATEKKLGAALDSLQSCFSRFPLYIRIFLSAVILLLTVAAYFPWSGQGLKREMWSKEQGVRYETIDRTIDFTGSRLRRDLWKADRMNVRWSGYFHAPESKEYHLVVEGDGYFRLFVDQEKIIHGDSEWQIVRQEGTVYLSPGSHSIQLNYFDAKYESTIRLLWQNSAGEWTPVPEYCFTLERSSSGLAFFLHCRMLLAPLFLVLLLIVLWHWLTIVIEWSRSLPPAQRKQWQRRILILILLLGIGLRFSLVWRTQAMTHADEAVVGLMAKHIAEGQDFPLMYYGQDYGGPLISYLIAPFFVRYGPSLWHLKLGLLALSSLWLVLVYRLACRWTTRSAALLATFLAAVPPVMWSVYGMMGLVGTTELVVLALLAMEAGWPLLKGESQSRKRWVVLGLVSGLGLWVNFQIVYYLLPLFLLFLFQGRQFWKHIHWLGTGLLVGALPLLVYAIPREGSTIQLFLQGVTKNNPLQIFTHELLHRALPNILGSQVRWQFDGSLIPQPLPAIVTTLFILALLSLAVRVTRKQEQSEKTVPRSQRSDTFLLIFFFSAVILFVFFGPGTHHPRYLFALAPMIAILLGDWVIRRVRTSAALGALVLLPFLLQNIWGNTRIDPFYIGQPLHLQGQGQFLPLRNSKLIDVLRKKGWFRLHTDYWLGYPITLESGETITTDCDGDRYAPYSQAFRKTYRPAYLFHVHDPRIGFYRNLFQQRLKYETLTQLPYLIFGTSVDQIPRSCWQVSASHNSDDSHLAIDGDLLSYKQYQAQIESGTASIEIVLGSTEEISSVVLVSSLLPLEKNEDRGLVDGMLSLSVDGTSWKQITKMKKDRTHRLNQFNFPTQQARTIRIENRPREFPYNWSIIDVFIVFESMPTNRHP